MNVQLGRLASEPPEVLYRSDRDAQGRLDSTTPIQFILTDMNPDLLSAIRNYAEELVDKGAVWEIACTQACKHHIWVEIVYFDGRVPQRYVDADIPTTTPFSAAETDMRLTEDNEIRIYLKRTSLMISSAHGKRTFRVVFVLSLQNVCTTIMTRPFRVLEKRANKNNNNDAKPSKREAAVQVDDRRAKYLKLIRSAYTSCHAKLEQEQKATKKRTKKASIDLRGPLVVHVQSTTSTTDTTKNPSIERNDSMLSLADQTSTNEMSVNEISANEPSTKEPSTNETLYIPIQPSGSPVSTEEQSVSTKRRSSSSKSKKGYNEMAMMSDMRPSHVVPAKAHGKGCDKGHAKGHVKGRDKRHKNGHKNGHETQYQDDEDYSIQNESMYTPSDTLLYDTSNLRTTQRKTRSSGRRYTKKTMTDDTDESMDQTHLKRHRPHDIHTIDTYKGSHTSNSAVEHDIQLAQSAAHLVMLKDDTRTLHASSSIYHKSIPDSTSSISGLLKMTNSSNSMNTMPTGQSNSMTKIPTGQSNIDINLSQLPSASPEYNTTPSIPLHGLSMERGISQYLLTQETAYTLSSQDHHDFLLSQNEHSSLKLEDNSKNIEHTQHMSDELLSPILRTQFSSDTSIPSINATGRTTKTSAANTNATANKKSEFLAVSSSNAHETSTTLETSNSFQTSNTYQTSNTWYGARNYTSRMITTHPKNDDRITMTNTCNISATDVYTTDQNVSNTTSSNEIPSTIPPPPDEPFSMTRYHSTTSTGPPVELQGNLDKYGDIHHSTMELLPVSHHTLQRQDSSVLGPMISNNLYVYPPHVPLLSSSSSSDDAKLLNYTSSMEISPTIYTQLQKVATERIPSTSPANTSMVTMSTANTSTIA